MIARRVDADGRSGMEHDQAQHHQFAHGDQAAEAEPSRRRGATVWLSPGGYADHR
jgi:hypothetical protein